MSFNMLSQAAVVSLVLMSGATSPDPAGGGCVVVQPPASTTPVAPSGEQAKNSAKPEARQPTQQRESPPPPPPPKPVVPLQVAAIGCRCGGDKTIVVSCQLTNRNDVPMTGLLFAASETGSMGINSSSTRGTSVAVQPSASVVASVVTEFSALMDCSSCKNSYCEIR
jgi:hypothetical protein